ncbi:hypothetical protein C4J89_0059 [Pseudomonas sp. R4-35-07]|nr:hypothetical protein C4J91_0059 [Pseudomonas sp. R3-52-08]AZF29573.1 hypothetical protein C4J89_0059 [Pseudomonas sp. R4-35-07]
MNKSPSIPCGRGLAPDCYLTAKGSVDWYTAIGGKPPPTLIVSALGGRYG